MERSLELSWAAAAIALALLACAAAVAPASAAAQRASEAPLGAGDVNGDGLADLVVTGPSTARDRAGATSTYVVFGKRDAAPVDLRALGAGGIEIAGTGAEARLAGDVNGDGRIDVVARGPSRRAAAVVFGTPATKGVDLRRLRSRGVRIVGIARGSGIEHLGPAGDVNGDGFADVYLALARPGGLGYITDYIVLGRPRSGVVNVRHADDGVLSIRTTNGAGIAGAGDLDGDGVGDLLLGNQEVGNCFLECGSATIVLGRRRSTASVDARRGGPRVMNLTTDRLRTVGGCISAAGDFNGDGRGDVAIRGTDVLNGDTWLMAILFGGRPRREQTLVSRAGRGRWLLDDAAPLAGHDPGLSFAAAGDLNHDRRADLLIVGADGAAHLLYGRGGGPVLRLSRQGPMSAPVVLRPSPDTVLETIAGAGDVNGDGTPDLIAGERRTSDNAVARHLVVFGSSTGAVSAAGTGGFQISGTGPRDPCRV